MFIVPLSGITPIESDFIKPIKAEEKSENTVSFGDLLKSKIQNVKDLESQSLKSAYEISTGLSNDIEGAMLDSTKASTAIQMTVQLTTRAVNAYKEIISMQI